MPERVRITDVSPRDGLQNEPMREDGSPIPTADKAELVRALERTGVDEIEITSFVSPEWVPQLGDAAELCTMLAGTKPAGMTFSALVPNSKGLDHLLQANQDAGERLIDKASVFTAASETFSRKNTNADIAETLTRFKPVIARAHEEGLTTRGYISCVIACPFEGIILPEAVADVARRLLELGVDEIDLGDTIGAGVTETTAAMLAAVLDVVPADRLVLHLHDTFGRAAECVRAALDMGLRSFDGSVAGLGGCPYASTDANRAPGNLATESLVRIILDQGFTTGVDLESLAKAADIAAGITGRIKP
ncbi:MAG TPA: hydroxymethylglutaryl-CoA lyase [Phycisphaerales bacterium]|nr:hydroxymethylglutaryl-CoA lyase [Phycisphaerales bacterium]